MPIILAARASASAGVCGELDAAALAAAAGVDLRLDDDARPDALGDRPGLRRRFGDLAARHADAELGQDLLPLELVDLHRGLPFLAHKNARLSGRPPYNKDPSGCQ